MLRPGDHLGELGAIPADEDTDRVLSIHCGVLKPVTDHTIGLAAAPSTPVEDLEDRALEEGGLRALLWGPDDNLLGHGEFILEFKIFATSVASFTVNCPPR